MEELRITLAAARKNAGKTQTEAGKEMNVAPNTISRWERGETYPSPRYWNAIEKCYGVSLNNISFFTAK